MDIKNVLIVKGNSQYDVLSDFADELSQGFKENGINVHYFNSKTLEDEKRDENIYNTDFDMVISFNSMMFGGMDEIVKNPNVLWWSFLVDHPYFHLWRMLIPLNNYMISCVDNYHVDYIKKYHPNVNHSTFVAHGGNIPRIEPVPYEDREYSVCLMGTMQDLDKFNDELNALPQLEKEVMTLIFEQLTSGSNQTVEEMLDAILKNSDIKLSKIEYTRFLSYVSFVDSYARAINRKTVVERLLEAGIKVDVFGNGWDKIDIKHSENLVIHGNVPYEDVLKTMCNSKIILNTLPLFRDGSHERVFTSMLCGAVCVTEINEYLPKVLNHSEDLVYFDMNDLDTLASNIKALLSNDELGKRISESGRKKAEKHHTWANRAKEIIDIAKDIEKIERNIYVKEETDEDYKFNSMITYIAKAPLKLMVEKVKASFASYEMTNHAYAAEIKTWWINNKRWDVKDAEGNIFFRDRIKEVKGNLENYIEKYNQLNAKERKVFNALIRFKLYVGPNDLSVLQQNKDYWKSFSDIVEIS